MGRRAARFSASAPRIPDRQPVGTVSAVNMAFPDLEVAFSSRIRVTTARAASTAVMNNEAHFAKRARAFDDVANRRLGLFIHFRHGPRLPPESADGNDGCRR